MANYSFQDPGDEIPGGAVINRGNFTQLLPGTEILVGKQLTINGGNWTNVKRQPGWTVTGGNWTQADRCSHLNPKLVERGLPRCADECRHTTEKEEITVDGVLVDTIYTYGDIIT